jgi:hypothetical protein
VRASLSAVRGSLSIVTLAAIALPGCAAPIGTAIVVGAMAADGINYYRMGPDGKTPMYRAPELDPTRKVNVQDCTKPVDFSAGNLSCR